MKRRKYTLGFLLGLILAVASSYSADAHCGNIDSYKMHKGHYAGGKLYGLHKCAYVINKDSKEKGCSVTITPEGRVYCE